jgi:hypothetical protein
MPALASTDVTVTVIDTRKVGKERHNRVSIAFGDGALTYPSGGVPMPAASYFGLSHLTDIELIDPGSASTSVWKYDYANKKLRGYEGDYAQTGDAGLAEHDITDAPPATTLYAVARGF